LIKVPDGGHLLRDTISFSFRIRYQSPISNKTMQLYINDGASFVAVPADHRYESGTDTTSHIAAPSIDQASADQALPGARGFISS
jgi:hypothetical protein